MAKTLLFLVFCGIALMGCLAVHHLNHETPLAGNYMRDQGFVLTVTQLLFQGRTLYQDIFWQYGPIPILVYEQFARFLGNSPPTYEILFQFLSILGIYLVYILVRRSISLPKTILFFVIVFQVLPLLNPMLIYSGFELILIALLAISYRGMTDRTNGQCVLYGVLFALLQFCKFGTHLTAAFAFLFIDALQFNANGWRSGYILSAGRAYLLILASYMGIVMIATAIMFLYMQPQVVRDVLWPAFMEESYTYVADSDHYPRYENLGYFLGVEFPALLGLTGCAISVATALRQRPASGTPFPYGLMLPPLFFFFSALFLFKHIWHYYQYSIYAAMGIPLLLICLGKRPQRIIVLLLLPYVFAIPYRWIKQSALKHNVAVVGAFVTPIGQPLSGSPAEVNSYQAIFAEIQKKTEATKGKQAATLALFCDNPGFYFFSGLDVAGRHAWYLPAWVRPWESKTVTTHLLEATAVVVTLPLHTPNPESAPSPEMLDAALTLNLPGPIRKQLVAVLTEPVFLGLDPITSQPMWIFSVSKAH